MELLLLVNHPVDVSSINIVKLYHLCYNDRITIQLNVYVSDYDTNLYLQYIASHGI